MIKKRNDPDHPESCTAEELLEQIRREMLCKTNCIEKHAFLRGEDSLESLKENFAFAFFAEGRRTLKNGRELLASIDEKSMSPGRSFILEEKNQSEILAEKGFSLLKKIDPPPEDPRWEFWKEALIRTKAVHELVMCIICYFDDMEWEKEDHPHLKAQVENSLSKFGEWEQEMPSGSFRKELHSLAGICRKLPEEFSAEYGAKKRFLKGCEDGVIAGGISDDWRIFRQKGARDTALYDDLPVCRGEGFLEIRLKGADELVITAIPDENKEFILICNGKKIPARLDEKGVFSMPSGSFGKEITLQIIKGGNSSPHFCALVTRNADWENKKVIPLFTARESLMPKDLVPGPVYEENPDLVAFYYAAWQSAWTHIFSCRKAPVTPYMNEGIRCHKIWIWDTCFMALFCRYAAGSFPGIQSLDNFYLVMHDNCDCGLKVHIPDNPPLFAWTEYEYFKHTGDRERIRKILLEHQYLQRHYHWLNALKAGAYFDYATSITAAEFVPGKGFLWRGEKGGMDNSPRGDDDPSSIYYVDLSSQQALSAFYIAQLARAIGEEALEKEWLAEYEKQKEFVNRRFWSEEDQMYLDRKVDESGFCNLLTPASFWPLLAEIADEKQTDALCAVLEDPSRLGGERPIPSVSREDKRFSPKGEYWRGGIWMPKVYMTVKGLEKYKRQSLADEIAEKILLLQYRTWKNFEPHTIWECYSPTEDKPATNKVDVYCRQDFCGWSALGPISLFIENILGVRDVDALQKRIVWDPVSRKKNGIQSLNMGESIISLLACPEEGVAQVETTGDFTLVLHGKELFCKKGKHTFPL